MFLNRIELLHEKIENYEEYPFSISSIQSLQTLELKSNITFFVGENGTGKSTLLEAVAEQCGFNTASGGRNNAYHVERSESALAEYIRLSWLPKVSNGFFLRSESFYNFASHIDEVGAIESYGGKSLHEQSHGESFLSLFLNRFNGKAIYLLDEPEAALSPQRQLTFMKIIHDLVEDGECQFIITTHSPILLGYPEATIYSFDDGMIQEVNYEDTDHYRLTKYFLEHRERFIKELLDD